MCDVVMEEDGTVEEESQTTVADDRSATMLDPDTQPVDGESRGLYEVGGELYFCQSHNYMLSFKLCFTLNLLVYMVSLNQKNRACVQHFLNNQSFIHNT